MTQLRLGCLICKSIKNTRVEMKKHLLKEHKDTMHGHLNIVDNFSCEEGSKYWEKFSFVTENISEAKQP